MEKYCLVKLFQAKAPAFPEIFIWGPFVIEKSRQKIFMHGTYKIFINEQNKQKRICIEQIKSKTSSLSLNFANKIEFNTLSNIPISVYFRNDNKLKRSYRGKIIVSLDRKGLSIKNLVKMEDYFASVIGSESLNHFSKEALKAQSVLVQTLMLQYHKNIELTDTTDKQAYLGTNYERDSVKEALKETLGLCLNIPVYYHSCCAGATSTSDYFKGKEIKSKSGPKSDKIIYCQYCKNSPFSKAYLCSIPLNDFKQILPEHNIENFPKIISKDSAGRPLKLLFPRQRKEEIAYMFWLKIGQKFGWDKVPSTHFTFTQNKNSALFNSFGAGHGVGMCQWGADGLAKKGKNFKFILSYYFPASQLLHWTFNR